MGPTEIKIGGLGGQGVILGGIIIGKAAALFDNKHSCLTQAFGPEARGSACSAQVVVDSDPILYPYVHKPHLMVAMFEEELVKPTGLPSTVKVYAVPATRIAEELGKKMVMNIVMVGFFAAVTGLVSEEAAREAVKDSVPPATIELNMKAFQRGFDHGKKLVAKA